MVGLGLFGMMVSGVAPTGLLEASAQVRVRIRTISGGTPGISNYDYGQSVARIGDLDNNGVDELAAGCPFCRVAVVWFMDADGSVIREQVIRPPGNGDFDGFGISTAGPGDIDGDGVPDLVIGSEFDTGGSGITTGAIWVYFLFPNGAARSQVRIILPSDRQRGAQFGHSVAAIGDRNGDGISELAVGAPGMDSGAGRVYVLFLDSSGRLTSIEELPSSARPGDRFGSSISAIGDLNGDRIQDLAVGSVGRNTGRGLAQIGFMESGGRAWRLGPDLDVGVLPLDVGDAFGTSIAGIGDVDGDGIVDIAVGAAGDDGSGDVDSDRGAAYRTFLRPDGSLKGFQRLSDDADGVFEQLSDGLRFGSAVGDLGDLDGDGVPELIVGTAPDFVEDPTPNNALWILYSLPLPLTSAQNMQVTPDQPVFGEPIAVRGRWGIGLNGATLFFRKAGDTSFLGAVMLESDAEVYETEIPAFSVGEGGAEYFVSLVSTAGTESRVPETGYLSIPVELSQGFGMTAPHGRAVSGFRLISFPLQLYEPDARMALEDDLGPYDPVRWRLYGFGPTLTELSQADVTLSPGRSYWFLSGEAGLQIDSGPGVTLRTDETFSVALNPGWNLVANPFPIPLPASAMRLASGTSIDAITYDGDWIPVGDELAPLEGLAVFSQPSDTLLFDPTHKSGQAKTYGISDGADWDWSVQISARAGGARDLVNVASVHSEARARKDSYDRPEPPTIGDYVSLYFPTDDQLAGRLRTDVRPSGMPGYIWPVEIRSKVQAPVRLSFSIQDVPGEYDVWLVDDDTGISRHLEDGFESIFAPYTTGGRARQLRVVVGVESYIRENAGLVDGSVPDFALEQNYPNPFRSVTSIRYHLAAAAPVELKIVDLLGRDVVTLVRRQQEAGAHEAVWDGRDDLGRVLSSGVFIARLQAGSFMASVTLTRIQ